MKLVKFPDGRYLNLDHVAYVEPHTFAGEHDGYSFRMLNNDLFTVRGVTPEAVASLTAWLDDLCGGE